MSDRIQGFKVFRDPDGVVVSIPTAYIYDRKKFDSVTPEMLKKQQQRAEQAGAERRARRRRV